MTGSVATSAMNGTVVLDVFAPTDHDAGMATASLVTATPDLARLFPRMIGADEGAPRAIAPHRAALEK